jgi:hypothetical protein
MIRIIATLTSPLHDIAGDMPAVAGPHRDTDLTAQLLALRERHLVRLMRRAAIPGYRGR